MPRTRPALPCSATTRAGNPCRAYAEAGSAYCRVHRQALPAVPAAPVAEAMRGAQGLYGRLLTPEDVASLPAAGAAQSLDDEIAFTRVVIRRLADLLEQTDGVAEATRLADALLRGTGRVADLLRAQQALSQQAAEGLMQAVEQALDELAKEWGVQL
jgi:hypothetical protein